MSYTLEYTAEQINHKLDLINENKNLLPYPYKYTTLQLSLEDVGDGSLLTTGDATVEEEIFLNNCSLLAGTYTASLRVTDIVDSAVTDHGFSLKIVIDGEVQSIIDGEVQSTSFTLSTTKAASIHLVVPANKTTKNLLIKPQIEKGSTATDWVPYMDKIGNYVDERFNSVNTKLRDVLAFMKLVEVVDV